MFSFKKFITYFSLAPMSYIDTSLYQFAQVIDFYLKPENKTYWDQIVQLSSTGKPEDDATLSQYILEGARLTTTLMSVRNFEPVDGKPIVLVVDQAGTKVTLNKGDRVITNPVCRPLRNLRDEKAVNRGGLTRPHPEILLHSPTRTISLLVPFRPYTVICANRIFFLKREC